jgi:hypothetical protein
MKPQFSIFVASLVLGLSVCSTSFASDLGDPTIQKDAAAELASLSQQIANNPKIKDKDKNSALKSAVEKYVSEQKKAYSKEKDHEEDLEKQQKKLEDKAKEAERQAEDKGPQISNAKLTEDKKNRDVAVADLVEDMYKHDPAGTAGVTLTSDSK